MNMQSEQTPKLPIKRELISVRKSVAESPLPHEHTGIHHFQHLHDKYLHEVDGEDCYECPLDLLAQYCAKHKDDFPRLTAILEIAANRGLHYRIAALKAGSTDPQEMFFVADHVEKDPVTDEEILREPAQAFVKTAEGKTILPLPIHDVASILGTHHHLAKGGVLPEMRSHGGQASLDALAVLEEFLGEVGLQPHHVMIRKSFCRSCRGE